MMVAVLGESAQAQTAARGNGVDILSGFSGLWIPGRTYDTGRPRPSGRPSCCATSRSSPTGPRADPRSGDRRLLRRPPQPELQRHRRPRTAGAGLPGGIGATTTIPAFDASTARVQYNDQGTGAGVTTAPLGKVVQLVNAFRNNASTSPAKDAYSYWRPWRQSLNGQSLNFVVPSSLVPEKGSNRPRRRLPERPHQRRLPLGHGAGLRGPSAVPGIADPRERTRRQSHRGGHALAHPT